MSRQKLLILGGAGFIGTNLINYFSRFSGYEKFDIYSTLHDSKSRTQNAKFYKLDLTNRQDVFALFDDIRPDIVINAAAVTTGSKDVIERPFLHVTDNIIMNSLVFEMCHIYAAQHCIFLSCSVPYKSSELPQKESDWKIEDIPSTYFGVGSMKVFSERLCEFYSRLGNCKYTAIRHSNVYGPYDKFDLDKCHVLPAMVNKVVNAKDSLEVWGDGAARRDLVYIDDLVEFIDNCVIKQTSPYELFNCGQGKAYPILEIINIIQKLTHKENLKLIYNTSKPNIPTTVLLDCGKAHRLLGWYPRYSLGEGLSYTIDWYEKNYKKL